MSFAVGTPHVCGWEHCRKIATTRGAWPAEWGYPDGWWCDHDFAVVADVHGVKPVEYYRLTSPSQAVTG